MKYVDNAKQRENSNNQPRKSFVFLMAQKIFS